MLVHDLLSHLVARAPPCAHILVDLVRWQLDMTLTLVEASLGDERVVQVAHNASCLGEGVLDAPFDRRNPRLVARAVLAGPRSASRPAPRPRPRALPRIAHAPQAKRSVANRCPPARKFW